MREQLIRYLLGELDADERRELRAQLRDNPELQRELNQLRDCFAESNEDNFEERPPGHLAERTADRISNSDEYELEAAIAAGPTSMSQGSDPPAGVLGWSLADLTVAGGVMLAVSMLVFPALRDSRDGMRSDTCKNNLIQMYVLVTRHANDHGRYPQVRPNERVGVIPAQLVKMGYTEPERLTVLMLCPASPRGRELRASPSLALFPNQEQLRLMRPDELSDTVANLPKCYGFRQPQYIGDQYVDARDIPAVYARFDPIFGDMPADAQDPMAPVHRGSLIQLMNRDGSLISINMDSPPAFEVDSDLFHNYLGVVAAGIGPHDVVLAPPDAMPGLAPKSDNRRAPPTEFP